MAVGIILVAIVMACIQKLITLERMAIKLP